MTDLAASVCIHEIGLFVSTRKRLCCTNLLMAGLSPAPDRLILRIQYRADAGKGEALSCRQGFDKAPRYRPTYRAGLSPMIPLNMAMKAEAVA